MAITFTGLALSAIGWVSMVSGQACFTVKPGGEVTTLLTHAAIHTCAVAIALACRALDEGPLKAPVFWAEPCLQHHVLAVFGGALHGSAIRTLHALSSASVTGVPTPAAIRLLQTQTTCTQTRAVLRHAVSRLPLQTLAVGKGDDVGIRVHTAFGASTPHALHGLAGAVLTSGAQGAGRLTRAGVLVRAQDWFLTDEAVCVGGAGIRPEARDLSSLQVSTEA